jgi:hypothetical protein
LRFHTVLFGPIGGHLPLHSYVLFLVFAVIPIYLILYFAFGLYKPRRTYKNIFSEATQIIKVNISYNQNQYYFIKKITPSI